MNDVIREFLLETHKNLGQLDLDLVTLEKDPAERETLARVFRTLHTVKGTAGFLGLEKLQALAHAGETLLGRLRAGELTFDPETSTALLGVVDAVRRVLAALEATQGASEGTGDYTALVRTLDRLAKVPGGSGPAMAPRTPHTPAPAVPQIAATIAAPAAPPPPPPRVPPVVPPAPPPPIVPTVATPAAPPPPPPEPAEARGPAVVDSAVRVDVGLLDRLMNLIGELVLARNQILQFAGTQDDPTFLGTVQRLNLLTSELQAGVMKTRMQPVGNLWGKFPRLVRDLAVACAKQVRLEMAGHETELDKTIIEAVRDPLTHMIRNAVDHGIEPPADRAAKGKAAEGRVLLRAFHEGGKVVIEVADDGGGIDPARVRDKAVANGLISADAAARMGDREVLRLVFLPGFSTTDRVTQFSGRGVGMDVVRTNVERIGGTVDLEGRPGHGTTVRMTIPLTLAIIPALTVAAGGDRYAIPQVSLLELVRVEADQADRLVEKVHGCPVYRLRGNLLPLVYLDRELGVEPARPPGGGVYIVVVQADGRPFGLVVEDVHDTEEIVVKPLQQLVRGVPVFSGATIMGDGRVALILDVPGLARRAGVVSARDRDHRDADAPSPSTAPAGDRHTVLLCATPGGGRVAIPLGLVARLEEFPRSAVERVGGRDVIQYRGAILPLVHVSRVLRRGTRRPRRRRRTAAATRDGGTIQVVVHAGAGRAVGLVVGRILDIAEETVTARADATRPGVLFTAVVQDRVTEFLDVEHVVRGGRGG